MSWSVTYTYDRLETSLGDNIEWDEVVRLIKRIKPGDSLTQVKIERNP